jgi:hypothetical protein
MKPVLALCALFFAASPAFADETMNLFPKGRAGYLDRFEQNAERYKSRGTDYINHVYSQGGESGAFSATNAATGHDAPLSDDEIDALIEDAPALSDDVGTGPSDAPPLPTSAAE